MRKRIAALAVAVVLLFYGTGTNVLAVEREKSGVEKRKELGISLMMVNVSQQYNVLTIDSSSGLATVQCKIKGKENVTKTSISATLQKKVGSSWANVKTWTATTSTNKTSLRKTKNVVSGSSYRVKATFKAYKGKSCETKITYSTVKKG